MTQEEKAKRYDEAFERARAFNNGEYFNIETGITLCEYIFPELKESEDEKIRKELTKFLKKASGGLLDTTIQCKTFGKWCAWLEKQGKKPQGKSALESINEEKVDNQNCVKPTDKVESKFKEGDWITNGEYTWKVISVDDLDYTLQNQCGECVYDTIDYVNKAFHLWTIQDAKDSDVLWYSNSASNGIFIFKKIRHDGKVLCYCDYDSEDHFCTGEYHTCCWSHDKYIKPATKEQCNLLFQKMKEAGYKWDADKKELQKEGIK